MTPWSWCFDRETTGRGGVPGSALSPYNAQHHPGADSHPGASSVPRRPELFLRAN